MGAEPATLHSPEKEKLLFSLFRLLSSFLSPFSELVCAPFWPGTVIVTFSPNHTHCHGAPELQGSALNTACWQNSGLQT